MNVLVDIVCVLGWLVAVWVCVYDWEDVAEVERRRALLGKTVTKRGQNRGKPGPEDENGNKFPGNSDENDSQGNA